MEMDDELRWISLVSSGDPIIHMWISVGLRAEISMAQRRTTDAAPRPLLLRGRRHETAGQMEAFIKDAVGLHLLGRDPHVNDDLVGCPLRCRPQRKVLEPATAGLLQRGDPQEDGS